MTTFNIKQASSKAVEFNNDRFNYASDWMKLLADLAIAIAKDNAERMSAFNSVCHIAYAQATQHGTQKAVRESLVQVRDSIENALGKAYARAFALACTEMEFTLPEQEAFEALDFSTFVGTKVTRNKKEAEHGVSAMLKTFRNKIEKLQKVENPQPWVKEEIDAYALIIKTLEDSASKE